MKEEQLAKESSRLLHGTVGEEDFTLLDANEVTESIPMHVDDYPQLLSLRYVIKGLHLTSADEPRFHGAEVELDNLTAWSGITGLSATQEYDMQENGIPTDFRSQWALTRPAELRPTGDLSGFKVELAWQSTFSASHKDTNARRQINAAEEVHATFTASNPQPWTEFQDGIKSLQDLLTFATRHPCAVRSVKLLVSGPERDQAELFYRPLVEPQEDTKTEPYKYLFTLRELSLTELLEKWDSLRSRIGMGIHVLFSLDYEKGGFIENRIMNAGSAAESIHRALRPDSTALPAEDHLAIKNLVREAVADNDNKGWVLQGLRNDPGFVQRMNELAAIPAIDAVEAIVGDHGLWAKWLRDARNAVAHLEGKNFEKIPAPVRWDLPAATIGILHLVFLAELGLSDAIQLQAVRMIYAPWTAGFRSEVATIQSAGTR